MLIGTLAAYGFLRLRFPGRNALFLIIVLLLSIPQQMVAVPLFQTLLDLNLLNTLAGLILTHTALRGQYHIDWGILSAASMLITAVPVLVFVLLRKYYIRGLIGWTQK